MSMTNLVPVPQGKPKSESESGRPVAGEPLLEAVDLKKSFGAVQALRGATLTCRAGEVTALVGDNGAGKSTLIKCLAGRASSPTSGTIRFGTAITDRVHASAACDARLGIETVYQDLALVDGPDGAAATSSSARELRPALAPLRFLDQREGCAGASPRRA